jgi:hypothetical protein
MKKMKASILLTAIALIGSLRLSAEAPDDHAASPFRLSVTNGVAIYTDYSGFLELDVQTMGEIQFKLGEKGLARGGSLVLRALAGAGWQSNDTMAAGMLALSRPEFDVLADTAGLIPFWPLQIPLMAGVEGAWVLPRGFELFLCLRSGMLARLYPGDMDALLMMQADLGCALMLGKRFGLRLEAGYGALDVDPMRFGPHTVLGVVLPL